MRDMLYFNGEEGHFYIPKEYMKQLGLHENTLAKIQVEGGRIIVYPYKVRTTIPENEVNTAYAATLQDLRENHDEIEVLNFEDDNDILNDFVDYFLRNLGIEVKE